MDWMEWRNTSKGWNHEGGHHLIIRLIPSMPAHTTMDGPDRLDGVHRAGHRLAFHNPLHLMHPFQHGLERI